MKRLSILALALLLAFAAGSGRAEAAEPRAGAEATFTALPGYIDPAELAIYGDEDNLEVEVNLIGPLIRFVAEALRGTDGGGELADALSRIESIRFQLFDLPSQEVDAVRKRTRSTATALERKGWQRAVRVSEDDLESYFFLKMSGQNMIGLVVLFLEQGEEKFGFINIAGDIDPAQIGRIGRQYKIDVLEDFQGELEAAPPPDSQ